MKILVTGATGSVGRLVIDHLVQAGAPVRALTVDPAKAALPAGVDVAVGYLGRPETLPAALAGVDTVYLAPLAAKVEEFAEAAQAAGVRRVVALSGNNAESEAELEGSSGRNYHRIEKTIEAAGFDWTFVRPGGFMNNTLGWAEEIRNHRRVSTAYPFSAQAQIDLRDIAVVAAKVLLESGHEGRRYNLSGPEAITQIDQVKAIGTAIGREIEFRELSPAEHRAAWLAFGVPAEAVDWLLDGMAQLTEHPEVPSTTFAELIGRPAISYARWAADNADSFR